MKDDRLADVAERVQQDALLLDDANLVFGRGDPDATVFIVGEAPGEQEDEQGEPFVGRSGSVLSKALKEVGLSDDVYIGNVVKYRPPENRDPRVDEVREHLPYLLEQISIVDPEVVVPLGNTATEVFFDEVFSGISQERGSSFTTRVAGEAYTVLPTYHPAATLYDPSLRDDFLEDLAEVARSVTR